MSLLSDLVAWNGIYECKFLWAGHGSLVCTWLDECPNFTFGHSCAVSKVAKLRTEEIRSHLMKRCLNEDHRRVRQWVWTRQYDIKEWAPIPPIWKGGREGKGHYSYWLWLCFMQNSICLPHGSPVIKNLPWDTWLLTRYCDFRCTVITCTKFLIRFCPCFGIYLTDIGQLFVGFHCNGPIKSINERRRSHQCKLETWQPRLSQFYHLNWVLYTEAMTTLSKRCQNNAKS